MRVERTVGVGRDNLQKGPKDKRKRTVGNERTGTGTGTGRRMKRGKGGNGERGKVI